MFREGIIRVVVDPTNSTFTKERRPKFITGFPTMGLFTYGEKGNLDV